LAKKAGNRRRKSISNGDKEKGAAGWTTIDENRQLATSKAGGGNEAAEKGRKPQSYPVRFIEGWSSKGDCPVGRGGEEFRWHGGEEFGRSRQVGAEKKKKKQLR